jgi:endonuclease YncB( thermonuclease family)
MDVRRALFIALLCLLAPPALAEARSGACVVGRPADTCTVWMAQVVSVNDGDTLDVRVGEPGNRRSQRIRIAAVQAMEQSQYGFDQRAGDCHAVDATLRLEQLVRRSRGRVRLAADDPETRSRGRFVRTLAVRSGGRWRDVGTMLIREGLALWWASAHESAGNRLYSVLLHDVIAAQRGIFDPDACGAGPSAGSPLRIWANWDADGNDTANPSGEWVKVRNLDPVNPVPIGGWHVRDSGLRRFTFPAGAAIAPGDTVTVSVGEGGAGVLGWGMSRPVFENASDDRRAMGDGAYLFDPLGNVRASMLYPCRGVCVDPAQGAVALSADPTGNESITVENVGPGPLALDGYVLKSPPYSYPLDDGTVLPPGGSLRIETGGDPSDDAPLERHWGFGRSILRNAGDVARLATFTDIRIACTSWGDRTC